MKDENEVQTAWEIWMLLNQLETLLWDRYDKEFLARDLPPEEIDESLDLSFEDAPQQENSCLDPLGSLGPIETQDKKEA